MIGTRFAPAAVVLAALLACALGSSAPRKQPVPCQRLRLDAVPFWSGGTVWGAGGRELIFVDILGGRLLRYSRQGVFLGAMARPGLGELEFTHPIRMLPLNDGYLLMDWGEHLIWFDRELRPLRARDFRQGTQDDGSVSVSDAQLLPDGKAMIVLGSVRRDGKWSRGFSLMNLDSLELNLVREVPYGTVGEDLYLLTRPVVALAGGVPYGLVYEQPPLIERLTAPARALSAFPKGFERLPELPPLAGPSAAPTLYAALENSSFPVALYGRGSYLYLLTRRREATGKPLWQLSQIDPDRDVVVRIVTLPTQANHLDIAPGAELWAFVEKGPVTSPGVQRIDAVLLLPTRWIEDPGSRELNGPARVECH